MRQLVYVSAAAPDFHADELPRILATARRNNPRHGVTGLLLYIDLGFLQVLEGPWDSVSAIYERIARDPRHCGLHVLIDQTAPARLFGEWSMGFERPSADDGVFALTQAALADRVTPEQSPEIAVLLRSFYSINKQRDVA